MAKHVVIVGGGIIGLSSAYYLLKEGHQVTVVDQSDFSLNGTSYINGGIITPSHIISLSAPGIITKGIKWMFNSESPFTVNPQCNLDFIHWFWAFKKSATKHKVESSIKPILDINLLSRDLYESMKSTADFSFQYERNGLLMAYKTDKAGEAEWEIGQRGIQEGLHVENLNSEEVRKLQPNLNMDVKGAVYFHSDSHTTPNEFLAEMIRFLKKQGVEFRSNTKVTSFDKSKDSIRSIATSQGSIEADEFIIATGSWTQVFTKQLGVKIPIQPGKGYSINVSRKMGITIPTILCEKKVAVTPMSGFTRFAGMMEIGGINFKINQQRVKAIAKAVNEYYPNIEIESEELNQVQCGLRPVSPDGLPYIGKLSKWKNITIASGHAMMGWSLGPATGKLVSELIDGRKSTIDVSAFHPERRF